MHPQDQACQKVDWPVHKLYCFARDLLNDCDKNCYAYDGKHQDLLLTVAHAFFEFDKRFAHLRGDDRLRFLDASRKSFLHIKLRPVENAPPGRWNRVCFVSAKLENISLLAERNRLLVSERLELRFPAICFGYSIINANGSVTSISTTTHPFSWPPPGSGRPLASKKSITLIRLFERMWILEAREEQAARRSERAARKAARKACTIGEDVEVGWMIAKEHMMAQIASLDGRSPRSV